MRPRHFVNRMITCTKCRTGWPDHALHCGTCGSRLPAPPRPPADDSALLLAFLPTLLWFAGLGGILYVAAHFITKYW